MTVYIEYAFLQNFLLDGGLLWLSLKAVKTAVKWGRLFFSACLGGFFAVVYPLLSLPSVLAFFLKIAVGLFLPLLAFGRVKNKREGGRYALNAVFFFLFTFLFGGALLSGMGNFALARLPSWVVVGCFALFIPLAALLFEKIYQKRVVFRRICPCEVCFGEKKAKIQGFYDSGNLASNNGLPVCFLSAELFYELCGEEVLLGEKDRGQACEEMAISTLSGERRVPLRKGILRIKDGEKYRENEVYFALSSNMIGREYKVILNARIFGEEV